MLQFPHWPLTQYIFWGCKNNLSDAFDVDLNIEALDFHFLYFLVCYVCYVMYFFLSGISFTDIDNSQDSRRREGSNFYSTLLLPPARKHSDIYLQLCTWDDYHILLIAMLVFTRLLLDDIHHLIDLLFDWLMM